MIMGSEKNTPLVCGGIYRSKKVDGRPTYTVTLTSVIDAPNKSPLGLIQAIGYAAERVEEGSDRLNQFDLVYSPVLSAPKKVTKRKVAIKE
tara:strand:- start:620 stop:892 length:273 start_codon:yes stop_codon:yes gene_type:complete